LHQGQIDEAKNRRAERIDTEAQNFIEVFLDEIEKNHGKQSHFSGLCEYLYFKLLF